MVDPIALYHQLCVEYENWLERAKARDERDLVFGLRHANVLAQSFTHLPALEVEEGGAHLGRLLSLYSNLCLCDSFRYDSRPTADHSLF